MFGSAGGDDLQPKEVRKQGVYNQCFVILEIY